MSDVQITTDCVILVECSARTVSSNDGVSRTGTWCDDDGMTRTGRHPTVIRSAVCRSVATSPAQRILEVEIPVIVGVLITV